ncbi:antibiotic biosynthesis monooxygenase [Alteromonadaceae bacterium M269]|nr:antibiotic biosynthesis monooxygenase [Alteromonadaceae bacterium M269]
MIILTASVIINEDKVQEALDLSQKHVNRSRLEPGCIAHGVHRDNENPNRLVFVEKWSDIEALETHFELTESVTFAKSLRALAKSSPEMSIYEATQLRQMSV